MLRRLLHIALNPFFQALVVAVIMIVIALPRVDKYYANQVQESVHFDQTEIIYDDLDHDGFSERIQTFYTAAGNVGITISLGNMTIGQWNFKGIYQPESPRIMIGDYNNNGLSEIYIFTLVADSVMLHGMEYSKNPDFILHDRFITTIGKSLKDYDHRILPGQVTEMNGDNIGDLVFGINTGFSRQPRNVFIYDIARDSLFKSPESGAFIGKIILADLDADPYKEVLVSTFAASNFNETPFPYTDTSCWLMLLDHDLRFVFPPVEFPGAPGGLQLELIHSISGEPLILVKYFIASPEKQFERFLLMNMKGEYVKEKIIKPEDIYYELGVLSAVKNDDDDDVIGIIENSGFYKINEELEISLLEDAKFSSRVPSMIDIDQDGHDEIIILAPGNDKHVILQSDFHHPVDIDFPIQSTVPVFSVKLNGKDTPQLSVQGDTEWMLFDYGINPVYRFRILIWLGVYLAILGFILLIRELYSFQPKKRYETEQKITRLQLSGIKAEMEPHFIMNTINTIGSSIYRQKGEEAYRLLLNFSGMVRSLLISSDKLTRTLGEEIEFVTNYLELERSRFGELFIYTINRSEEVSTVSVIPKMIIQLHAENALKHGLIPRKSGGKLDIDIQKEGEDLQITITDNGVGRGLASKQLNQSTGKGMKILWQLFETYNRHNQRPLRQEIEDLTDEENRPTGTRIRVYIPLDFNEGIF